MSRCELGPKKLRMYSKLFGRQWSRGFVRGNTGHRIDLIDSDGRLFSFYPCDIEEVRR